MSNNCTNPSPCCTPTAVNESLASQLQNLITTLLGTFVVTVVNGRATWTAVCNPNSNGLACFPKANGEGLICYFIRILDQIALFASGAYNPASAYCKNTIVAYGNSLYRALQNTTGNQPDISPTHWAILITAPTGPQGNQGTPGAPGAGSAINYNTNTITGNYSATDADAVIFCNNATLATVTVPAGLLSGKWFIVKRINAGNVDVTITGGTIDGAGTLSLTAALSSVTFVRRASTTEWYIV